MFPSGTSSHRIYPPVSARPIQRDTRPLLSDVVPTVKPKLIPALVFLFYYPSCHERPKQRPTIAFQLMEKKIYSSGYGSKSRKRRHLIYVSASPGFGAGEISPRYFQLQPKLFVTASPAQKLQDSPQLGYLIQKYVS